MTLGGSGKRDRSDIGKLGNSLGKTAGTIHKWTSITLSTPADDCEPRRRRTGRLSVHGGRRKVRPALVVQNDRDNARMTNTIVAQISENTARFNEPTQHLIELANPGQNAPMRQALSALVR
jgi:PemK-like, MazF-like toxin of type II toxin-antitoxin system